MCGDKRSQLNCEKNNKLKLVKVRKIIQNKFRKAHKDRLKREIELSKKYEPITTAINNLNVTKKGRNGLFKIPAHQNSDNRHSINNEIVGGFDDFNDGFNRSYHENSDDNRSPNHNFSDQNADSDSDIYDEEMLPDFESSQEIYDEDMLTDVEPSQEIQNSPARSKSTEVSKRVREESSNDEIIVISDSDSHDLLVENKKTSKKKSRLSRADMVAHDRTVLKKRNRKIIEVETANNIRNRGKARMKEKSLINSDLVEVVMREPPVAVENIEMHQIPKESGGEKRKNDRDRMTKFVRAEQTPVAQKLLMRKKYWSFSSRPKQAEPTESVERFGFVDHPFLTADEMNRRRSDPDNMIQPNNQLMFLSELGRKGWADDGKKSTLKGSSKKKKGGCIESEFIPYNDNIAYEFYDDPNELCERLRLLLASRAAGNTNHSQEINSIIAELRELGIIK